MNDLKYDVRCELATSEIIDKRGLFIGNDSKDISVEIDYFIECVSNYGYEL